MRLLDSWKSTSFRTHFFFLVTFLILSLFVASCSGTEFFPETARDQSDQGSHEAQETDLVLSADEADEAEEERIILFITAVIGLLLIASLVGIATSRLRLPYTVGLVLIGLALALRGQEPIDIPPQIFLGLLVPPLIFEAAFHLRAKDLLKDLVSILALAIPGVLITTFLVGGVVAWGTGFPLSIALVFGALVAATDPVAVVALSAPWVYPKD